MSEAAPSTPDTRRVARRVAGWGRVPEVARDGIGLAARLLVAAVWLVAGYLKTIDANATARSVAAYRLLPDALVTPVAAALPYLEIAVGVLLLLGLATRLGAALSALLLVAFLVGIVSAAARGLTIDCGCFGAGGEVAPGRTAYTSEILRDAGLLVASACLLVRPRSLLAVDRLARRDAPLPACTL